MHLRLHVACARPAQLADFVAWAGQVAQCQAALEAVQGGAAEVDDCYDVLAQYGVKPPMQDQASWGVEACWAVGLRSCGPATQGAGGRSQGFERQLEWQFS